MNFKKAFLTFLSVAVSVTPCYSNAMKESDACESLPVNQSEEIKECVICLDPMKEGEEITTSGCGSNIPHKFHRYCWEKWCIQAPRDADNKVACPVCKEPCEAPAPKRYCPFCREEVKENEGQFKFKSCSHRAHWQCTAKFHDFLKPLLENNEVAIYADYCYDCYALSGYRNAVFGNDEHPVSPERLKEIVIRAYPELGADLGQQQQAVPVNLENQQVLEANLENRNSCSRRLWKCLGLVAFAAVIFTV